MIVTFVHHSCFVVEMNERMLIFDYFRNENVNGYEFTGVLPDFPKDKPIYVFSSHFHQDHFDLEILRWAKEYENISYILSKTIRLGDRYLQRNGIDPKVKEKITFTKPDKKYFVGDMEIKTLKSTDVGVAYLVYAEGKCIFHAGDLNTWKWEGAGDLVNGREEKAFKREMHKLEREEIDVAFVPVDSRQQHFATDGLDYYMKNIDAKAVFPMHMWQDYSPIAKYKAKATNAAFLSRLVTITGENEAYEIL